MNHNIAIDGPAGAGKSTIAKAVAARLGHIYVDTGAMYRAMALYFMENKLDLKDEGIISGACDGADVSIEYVNGTQRVILCGEDVSEKIRDEKVGNSASIVSVYPAVRSKMTALQQKLASVQPVVMDGRDIGTVVLPDAACKIFLDASPEVRAKRRVAQLAEKGVKADYEEVLADIRDRDERDRNRPIAPLVAAVDATTVDTSDLTAEEVIGRLLEIYHSKVD
jgi:cytidylate kinase